MTTSHTAAVVERVARAIVGREYDGALSPPGTAERALFLEVARAALDASGHAEMIAALQQAHTTLLAARLFLPDGVFKPDHQQIGRDTDRTIAQVDAALAKGRASEPSR